MTPMQRVDVLRAACCVACSDGEIATSELGVVQRLAKEVGVGKASLAAMIDRSTRDENFHKEQFKILKENPQQCLATVLEVAMADGVVTDVEMAVLQSLADNLNVPTEVFNELMSKVGKMM
jgi:tellurite resistance protein